MRRARQTELLPLDKCGALVGVNQGGRIQYRSCFYRRRRDSRFRVLPWPNHPVPESLFEKVPSSRR